MYWSKGQNFSHDNIHLNSVPFLFTLFYMRQFLGFLLFTLTFTGVNGQTGTPTPTPAAIKEEVIVTAGRSETRLGDTPASITTLSRSETESTAAPTIDDTLRQTVGFSIFRRSSSRNANPTTQGVSLRGVGSSGASRSVILFDGVPLNDPFGGWIQWNRVPIIELESAEVLRGGASGLYGDSGLSGAVNLIPRRQRDGISFSSDVFAGSQRTISGSGVLGFGSERWSGSVVASNLHTRGFVPVDAAARGPVDSYAGTRNTSFSGRINRRLGASDVFLRPSYFGEVRTNGTGLQTNRTHIRQLAAGGTLKTSDNSATRIEWRAFGGTQVYDQVFSAINALRTAESLTRVQRVPVQNIGVSGQVSAVFGNHTVVAGGEARNVRGASDEIVYANNAATSLVGAGGRQNIGGGFIQDIFAVGKRLILVGVIRADRWSNYRGQNVTRTLSTNQLATVAYPDRTETALSPRGSALFRVSNSISLYGGASRSFRSPTLNELYRSFRVGNVLTLSNAELKSETAINLEGGVMFGRGRTFVRSAVFRTAIDGPVANVTISSTPSLITRQRQNAGTTRSLGCELEAERRFDSFALTAGYVFVDPKVTSFPSNPILAGLEIPQVARHQFTFQFRYSPEKWMIASQFRASSSQFDDDLNQFRLEPYGQIDLFVSRRIKEKVTIYAAVENVTNSRYSVGKTPIRTVSSPTNLRIGLRWK